jgi:putative tryptophan/tyrosine transport system substrate-binding protein
MDRRTLITWWVAAGLSTAIDVAAQQASKTFVVGLLVPDVEPSAEREMSTQTMLAGLRELGWIEGKNLVLETRMAGLNPQRQRELAAELKALPVALIIAPGTITIRAAREGAPGVPIVMVNAGDPVGAGFVASLARPGGDLTGTSGAGEEVLAKQVELLSAAVPRLKRIYVLMNSANPANRFFFDAMGHRAQALGLQLERLEVAAPTELEPAIARARGGALVVVGDPMFYSYRDRIAQAALLAQVPSVYGGRQYVAAGGLMSFLSSFEWHWRTAAGFVDKILKGAKPADIPIQQPQKFDLTINLRTARALGLAIPREVLLRAGEVIE